MLNLPKVPWRIGLPVAIVVGLLVGAAVKMRYFPSTSSTEPISTAQVDDKDASPKDKDVTPKDKDATPKDKDATPKDKDATPKGKDVTPKDKDATPKGKDVTPKDKDATPKDKDTTPKDKVIPKDKVVLPKAKALTFDEQKAKFREQIKGTTANRRGQLVIDAVEEVPENAVNAVAREDGWFVQKGIDADRNARTWILTRTKR